MSITKERMPEDLDLKVQLMTAFQRTYCEFRARGFSQSECAKRAGSSAIEKKDLGRVGFGIETTDGAKEYIDWLKTQRAKTTVIDRVRVIEMISDVYKAAMSTDDLKEANNSAKLLGQALGLFDHKSMGIVKKDEGLVNGLASKNNTNAFKDEDDSDIEPNQVDQKYSELQAMLKELNTKGKN